MGIPRLLPPQPHHLDQAKGLIKQPPYPLIETMPGVPHFRNWLLIAHLKITRYVMYAYIEIPSKTKKEQGIRIELLGYHP